MCRWLTYKGPPIYLADLLYTPKHSLIDQSLNALEAKTGTNGDGFGIGWYRERVEPGVYREVMPAWNDANLRSLAHQIRAGAFFCPCTSVNRDGDQPPELPPVFPRVSHPVPWTQVCLMRRA